MADQVTDGPMPDQNPDVSAGDEELNFALRAQAERCRRLARGIDDRRARQALNELAESYEAAVAALATASLPRRDAGFPEIFRPFCGTATNF